MYKNVKNVALDQQGVLIFCTSVLCSLARSKLLQLRRMLRHKAKLGLGCCPWVQNFLSQNFLATVAEIRRLRGVWRMPRWLLQEEGKRREQVQAQVRTPGGKMSTLLTDDSIFPVKCERPSLESRDRDSLEEEEDRVKSCSGGRAS